MRAILLPQTTHSLQCRCIRLIKHIQASSNHSRSHACYSCVMLPCQTKQCDLVVYGMPLLHLGFRPRRAHVLRRTLCCAAVPTAQLGYVNASPSRISGWTEVAASCNCEQPGSAACAAHHPHVPETFMGGICGWHVHH